MNKINGHLSGLGPILYNKLYVWFDFIHFSNTEAQNTSISKTTSEGKLYKEQQILLSYVEVRKINDHINIKILKKRRFQN